MTASTLSPPQRGWFDVLDDWILNATALSLWNLVWTTFFPLLIWHWWIQLTGTTFVTSWYTHGLASSYLEGANFLIVQSVSTPADAMGHLSSSTLGS